MSRKRIPLPSHLLPLSLHPPHPAPCTGLGQLQHTNVTSCITTPPTVYHPTPDQRGHVGANPTHTPKPNRNRCVRNGLAYLLHTRAHAGMKEQIQSGKCFLLNNRDVQNRPVVMVRVKRSPAPSSPLPLCLSPACPPVHQSPPPPPPSFPPLSTLHTCALVPAPHTLTVACMRARRVSGLSSWLVFVRHVRLWVSRHDPSASSVDASTLFIAMCLKEADSRLSDPHPCHFSVVLDLGNASLRCARIVGCEGAGDRGIVV